MAGRDDYGGSGRPGSNNSTGGGFSGDRSGGVGGGNASNFGGGGGNIRTASGANNKDRGQPMGPGGTGFNPQGRYANGLQAMMSSIGGKGGPALATTSLPVKDRRRNPPITPRPTVAPPPSGVPWRPGITSQINWDEEPIPEEVVPGGWQPQRYPNPGAGVDPNGIGRTYATPAGGVMKYNSTVLQTPKFGYPTSPMGDRLSGGVSGKQIRGSYESFSNYPGGQVRTR